MRPEWRTFAWTPPNDAAGSPLPHAYGWFVQNYNGGRIVWQFGVSDNASSSMIMTRAAARADADSARQQLRAWCGRSICRPATSPSRRSRGCSCRSSCDERGDRGEHGAGTRGGLLLLCGRADGGGSADSRRLSARRSAAATPFVDLGGRDRQAASGDRRAARCSWASCSAPRSTSPTCRDSSRPATSTWCSTAA